MPGCILWNCKFCAAGWFLVRDGGWVSEKLPPQNVGSATRRVAFPRVGGQMFAVHAYRLDGSAAAAMLVARASAFVGVCVGRRASRRRVIFAAQLPLRRRFG